MWQKGILFFVLCLLVSGGTVYGEEDGLDDTFEEQGAKVYLQERVGKFEVSDFTVTHYAPLDSALFRDLDTIKRLGPKVYSPVQWYKESGGWVFSAATEYRRGVAEDAFREKLRNQWEERERTIDNHDEKVVYELVFPSGVSFSQSERKSVLPLGCKGEGTNYGGSPWSGSSGKIPKTGMIAADRGVLPEGTNLYIEGYGKGQVLDVGSAIKGMRLDLTVNNCEIALKKGKQAGVAVAFDPSSAKISGSKLTSAMAKDMSSKGVYKGSGDYSEEVNSFNEMAEEQGMDYVTAYQTYFQQQEISIQNTGVDDRTSPSAKLGEYMVAGWLTETAVKIHKFTQVISVFLIGYVSILWMMAFMAYSGMGLVNEWLYKLTMRRADVGVEGFGSLWNMTWLLFLISVIIITGLVPKIISLVYWLLQQVIDWIWLFT